MDAACREVHGLSSPGPVFFQQLGQIVDHLVKWVFAEIAKEDLKLRQVVTQRFTLDELYSGKVELAPELNPQLLTSKKAKRAVRE